MLLYMKKPIILPDGKNLWICNNCPSEKVKLLDIWCKDCEVIKRDEDHNKLSQYMKERLAGTHWYGRVSTKKNK